MPTLLQEKQKLPIDDTIRKSEITRGRATVLVGYYFTDIFNNPKGVKFRT